MGIIPPFLVFVIITLAGVVTVTGTFFSQTDPVLDARVGAADRTAQLNGTKLELVSATYTAPQIDLVFRNVGRVPLRDFASWDLWASFHELDGTFHPERLAYTTTTPPSDDQWAMAGLYLDAATAKAEASQPGILDPSEEVRILVRVSPAATDPQANTVTLGLPVGATAKVAFTWEALADTPAAIDKGGSLANDGTYVYALRGDKEKHFYRYDPATDAWTQLADTPDDVQEGGSLVYATDGGTGYLYALRGANRKHFWRYDIAGDAWTSLDDTPQAVKDGGSLAWDGVNTIYVFRGNHTLDFWAYDIPSDTWRVLAEPPDDLHQGTALVYVDGRVYAMRGHDDTAFWRYNPGDDTWTTLTDTPANVASGGALATDGTDVYALRGDNQDAFWKYSVARNTWTVLPDTPGVVEWGGSLTVMKGMLYGLRGNKTPDFWQYPLPVYRP